MVRTTNLATVSAVLAGLLLFGCDATVDPIRSGDRSYSMYGQLDPTADTQAVRVYLLGARLDSAERQPVDATVTSTHLQSGRRRRWRDSLSRIRTGELRRVYWAPIRVEYGDRYRISAVSPHGDSAWATVRVPPKTEGVFAPADTGRAGLQATITGPDGVPSLINPRLIYVVANVPPPPDPRAPPRPQIVETLRVDMAVPLHRVGEGFRFRWDARDHYFGARRKMSRIDTLRDVQIDLSTIVLRTLWIEYVVTNESWRQDIVDRPDRELAQPGVLTNVRNGLGYVGAAYRVRRSYRPPREVLDRAGF